MDNLNDWGFYDVFLPFLLIYVIVFAILEKTKIFKVQSDDSSDNRHVKNVNAVIAFVIALFGIASLQTVRYIQDIILNVILVLIFLLVTFITLGFIFGEHYMQLLMKKEDGEWRIKKGVGIAIGVLVVVVMLGLFLFVIGWLDNIIDFFDPSGLNNDTFTTLLVLLAIAGILYWITKGSSSPKKSNNNE